MELTYSHKYITNTFTCETVLIEYLLNGDRGSHTTTVARMITMYLSRMEKTRGKYLKCPWEGVVKGKESLILGTPIHQLGDQPGQKGSFRGSEESGEDTLRQAE